MPVADQIAVLLEALKGASFEGMRPAQRRHLRDLCRYIADKADPDAPAPPKEDTADPNSALCMCSCRLGDGPIRLCPRHQEIVDGTVEVHRAALRPFERMPWEVPGIVLVKLLLHPVIVLWALILLGPFPPEWTATALLMASLPPALSVFVIAQQYETWIEQASATVLVGTFVSVVTLTAMLYLIKSGQIPL